MARTSKRQRSNSPTDATPAKPSKRTKGAAETDDGQTGDEAARKRQSHKEYDSKDPFRYELTGEAPQLRSSPPPPRGGPINLLFKIPRQIEIDSMTKEKLEGHFSKSKNGQTQPWRQGLLEHWGIDNVYSKDMRSAKSQTGAIRDRILQKREKIWGNRDAEERDADVYDDPQKYKEPDEDPEEAARRYAAAKKGNKDSDEAAPATNPAQGKGKSAAGPVVVPADANSGPSGAQSPPRMHDPLEGIAGDSDIDDDDVSDDDAEARLASFRQTLFRGANNTVDHRWTTRYPNDGQLPVWGMFRQPTKEEVTEFMQKPGIFFGEGKDWQNQEKLRDWGRRGWQSAGKSGLRSNMRTRHLEPVTTASFDKLRKVRWWPLPQLKNKKLDAVDHEVLQMTLALFEYEIDGAVSRLGGGILDYLEEIIGEKQALLHGLDGGFEENRGREGFRRPEKDFGSLQRVIGRDLPPVDPSTETGPAPDGQGYAGEEEVGKEQQEGEYEDEVEEEEEESEESEEE